MEKKVTGFSLSEDVMRSLDKKRGLTSRSTWLEAKLRKMFKLPAYQRGEG